MNCYVTRSRLSLTKKYKWSHEYLDIDAFFFDHRDYELFPSDNDEDPFTLPSAIVELENDPDHTKIGYCLWKLLCIRSPIRILICYQKGKDRIQALVQKLDDSIWQGSLLKGDASDFLLIVGDDSKKEETSWRDYFTVYEWRNDKLTIIEGVEE